MNSAALLVSVSTLVVSQQHPGTGHPVDTRTENSAMWEQFLNEAIGTDDIACIVDLPDGRAAFPLARSGPIGRRVLASFADLFDRELVVVDRSVVLARRPVMRTPSEEKDGSRLLALLGGLSTDFLLEMATDGFEIKQLPNDLRAIVAQISNHNPGLGQAIVAGDRVQAKLYASPVVRFVDPNTGRTVTTTLAEYPVTSEEEMAARERLGAGAHDSSAQIVPLAGVKESAYDFGTGRVVTARDLVNECKEELGLGIVFDKRLGESSIYVRGRFSKHELFKVLQRILSAQQPAIGEGGSSDRANTLNELLELILDLAKLERFGQIGSVSKSDLLSNRRFTASELAGKNPRFREIMKHLGIEPDSGVSVGLGLGLSIYADGYSEAHQGSQRVITPNYVQYRINP